MPEKKVSVEQSMYLNESAFELPDTGIAAVRKESIHLYNNAFAIIAHGLSLHRHDIISEKDLETITTDDRKVIQIDIDEQYNKNVKDLYSEIIIYISKAKMLMMSEQTEELFLLRTACRDIVEAIKDTKHLHKNMSKYITSDNEYIRAEYNKIRVYLGSVLRQISVVQNSENDPIAILSLDTIKLDMAENDSTANGMLEELIHEDRISANMATSLMNDSAYVRDVTKKLIQMGEILFATGDQPMKEAERAISLDKDEVDSIMQTEASRI